MPQLDTAKTNRVVKWMQGYPAQEHLQSMSHARIAKLASCIFWPIPITRTGLIRSPLLEHNDHRFWFYPITFSGFPESVIGIQYR